MPRRSVMAAYRGFEGHSVAEPLQLCHGAPRGAGRLTPIVVVCPRLPVVHPLREHMVDRAQQVVGDGYDHFLVPAMAHHAAIAGTEGAVLLADRDPEVLSPSRFCSACSNATMRGAESSHVRLTADSPVSGRIDIARAAAGAMLAHFHAAWVGPRP